MITCYVIGDQNTLNALTSSFTSFSLEWVLELTNDFYAALKQIIVLKTELVFVDERLIKAHEPDLSLLRQVTVVITVPTNNLTAQYPTIYNANEHLKQATAGSLTSDRNVRKYQTSPESLFIKKAKSIYGIIDAIIPFKDIIYIESFEDYLNIHMEGDKNYRTHMTLKSITTVLSSGFQRINKSYIINNSKITAVVGRNYVILNDNIKYKLPIGTTYKSGFSKWKKQHLKRVNDKKIDIPGLLSIFLFVDWFSIF
ncbi:LytR/AlgR family response regulator transcription factor [Pararcticibacter amylolyticus]|uniref:HTH LytTR-type domain-containing protein n=1 Tax=Pararcticibacter amylolyticus TaxID=2173175 RepID=A0A2U2PJA0_9SPHI|nr:LytTR family DNA-binding domain-containing protein [Pararcticibacter amylolyticus]PWG81342.1 hypothetical protein DDR33_08215 [Pararcticibacter amylolyticus]